MSTLTGLLLTRHWNDKDALTLAYWAHTTEGPVRLVFQDQKAVCFVDRDSPLSSAAEVHRTSLALSSPEGLPVDALYFSRQRDLHQLRQQNNGVRFYESDVKAHDRFLMERFITAGFEAVGDVIPRNGYRELINPRLRPAHMEPSLRHVSLDIETDGIDGPILSVALTGAGRELILMQGTATQWDTPLPIRWYDHERLLLQGMFEVIHDWDPDLIIGWNLINFDLDYIERRCRHFGMAFALGRGGERATILQPQQSGQARIANIPGRVALDGIDHLRAGFWHFESFELGFVAHELLGRTKLIEDPDNKIREIQRLFREDQPALAAYNLEDARLVEAIFEKTELINFIVQRSVMTGLALGRQGGSVAAFDNLYLPRLHRAGVVAHDVGASEHHQPSPGGYVMESQPGLYDNVLVLDFKSLYPSIIRTFRIDPLGLWRPGDDPVPGFLDASFSRTDAILPSLIKELWTQRDEAKRSHNRAMSQAIKIIMNSFYGVLGSPGCRFFDPRLASSITMRGHEIIQLSRDWIEAQGHRVIYGDTDSVFVLLGPGYDEPQSRARGAALAHGLNRWWIERIERAYRLPSYLEIEFETHFLRFLMPTVRSAETGSKKRYAGTVRNHDASVDLVFKGLESVRSDWTPLAKAFQRELYRRVFLNEPWERFVQTTVDDLRSGRCDELLVYRKRIRQSLDAYVRNVPPHIQAARKEQNSGRWSHYVITVNGPEPIKQQRSPIDYQHYVDRQLAPVADGILHFLGDSFERFASHQMDLLG